MNVNIAEHQRSILAAMGIELWIPKVDVQTRHYNNVLHRDVVFAESEVASPIAFSDSKSLGEPQLKSSIPTILHHPEVIAESEVSLLKVNQETLQTEVISSSEQIQKQTALSVEPVLSIEAFDIQAFQMEHCLIVVDSTQLDDEQKMLWANIQRAVLGQYYDLKWPFPMPQFQDGRGAVMYIQGFVDALKQERKILCLGKLEYLNRSDVIQLASLAEMIEQPSLKRRLWQFMQNRTSGY